jgi:hypothetical protein
MSTNQRLMHVPRDAVWAVLADGYTYADWVVGTRAIRMVDEGWPAVGTRLHYTVGRWPLRHDGHTEVVSVDVGSCLEMEAHAWPAGSARIEIRLADAAGLCLVTMVEHPTHGLGAILHNPLADLALTLRNAEVLRRLERCARAKAAGAASGVNGPLRRASPGSA